MQPATNFQTPSFLIVQLPFCTSTHQSMRRMNQLPPDYTKPLDAANFNIANNISFGQLLMMMNYPPQIPSAASSSSTSSGADVSFGWNVMPFPEPSLDDADWNSIFNGMRNQKAKKTRAKITTA